MMLLPRRSFLIGSTLGWFSSSSPSKESPTSSTLDDWADLICAYTPSTFRKAVQHSHHFLYRGGGSDEDGGEAVLDAAQIEHPGPDLLLEGTYEDPRALEYFKCLEERLGSFAARPSTGHIVTSDPLEAAQWGPVVSVWPLGTEWSFVWPQDRSTLFMKNITCGRQEDEDTLVLNSNLPEALKQPREVLFASTFPLGTTTLKKLTLSTRISPLWKSAFVTIPMEEDENLRRKLQERNYGL